MSDIVLFTSFWKPKLIKIPSSVSAGGASKVRRNHLIALLGSLIDYSARHSLHSRTRIRNWTQNQTPVATRRVIDIELPNRNTSTFAINDCFKYNVLTCTRCLVVVDFESEVKTRALPDRLLSKLT